MLMLNTVYAKEIGEERSRSISIPVTASTLPKGDEIQSFALINLTFVNVARA